MKIFRKIIIVVTILLFLALGITGIKTYQYYVDSQDNRFAINVELTPKTTSLVEGNTLAYNATNCGYSDVLVREIVVLSVYDETGEPVPAGGSTYAASCVELLEGDLSQRKAVQDNQVIYVSEYAIEAGKILFENAFSTHEETDNTYLSEYPLKVNEDRNVRIDVILQGRISAEDNWEVVANHSAFLGDPAKAQGILAQEATIPSFTNTVGYQWKINKDKAVLLGLGSISEKNIVIPSRVMLSQVDGNVVYDPLNGTDYPVEVGSVSFYGTDIETVLFQDGVTIESNSMGKEGQSGKGLFGNCVSLVSVENIPDTVTNMSYTFSGCTKLAEAPVIPENVQVMKGCFADCVSLSEIPTLPENLENISSCFKGCTALKTVASLPDSITNMEEAFAGCTSLESFDAIPASVENMKRCFRNCTGLQELPVLPMQFVEYNGCFAGCSSATGEIRIPEEAINYEEYFPMISGMFDGCEKLERIVVPCCKHADIVAELPEDILLSFEFTHTDVGLCQGCLCVTDTYKVDGLTVFFDDTPDKIVQRLLVILDTETPDVLKERCRKLTFTQSLEKYDSTYADDIWAGFARYPDSTAFVETVPLAHFLENATKRHVGETLDREAFHYSFTIVHELGHTYDYNFSTVARYSGSQRWKQLCQQEGAVFVQELREHYSKNQYPEEMFARALEEYFVLNTKNFREVCPGMYAYLDELFGDTAQ